MMNIEELLPVMAHLADKYTSKESTSVSYDTAQRLMEAVLYCIHECDSEKQGRLLEGTRLSCRDAYEEGYRIAHEKVIRAKALYHQLTEDFDDFECRNYRDTILKGMPAFFTEYDLMFDPQNHVLSLDYPVIKQDEDKKGIDLILEYLEETAYEQKFLKYFSRKGVMDLLEFNCTDYRELYLDNICEPVLLRGAACLASDMAVYDLRLDEAGYAAAKECFTLKRTFQRPEDTVEAPTVWLEGKLGVFFDILEKNIMKEDYRGIFRSYAHEAAVRLLYYMQF